MALTSSFASFQVTPVPCLSDNYAYILYDTQQKVCAVVDPVEPEKIMRAMKGLGIDQKSLQFVLTTHRHADHSGGNIKMAELFPMCTIIGGIYDSVPAATKEVQDEDSFDVGSLNVRCLHTPCHTKGHICYYVTDKNKIDKVVFTGDTMFTAGVGKFFEGSAEQMFSNYQDRLGKLPAETKVFCGHEYTCSNLAFGVETVKTQGGDSSVMEEKLKWALETTAKGHTTQPSSIGEEKTINVFMMAKSSEEMKELRSKKDAFKYVNPKM